MCDTERSCIFPRGRRCPDHDQPDGPRSFADLFAQHAPPDDAGDDDAGQAAADTAA
jgi:hypothetical protein